MKSDLNEFLHYRVLAAKHDNEQALSRLIDSSATESPLTRQIATVVSSQLVDDLDELLSVLKMTKRQFMERALIDAMCRARYIMEDLGLEDHYEEQAELALGGAK